MSWKSRLFGLKTGKRQDFTNDQARTISSESGVRSDESKPIIEPNPTAHLQNNSVSNYDDSLLENTDSEIFEFLEKYYMAKNEMFQYVMSLTLEGILPEKTPVMNTTIESNIKRLSALALDRSHTTDERTEWSNIVIFLKDIQRFVKYFSGKGVRTSVREVVDALRLINKKRVRESNERLENEIYGVICKRVDGDFSVRNIAIHLMKYSVEKGERDILAERMIVSLPPLLRKFGYNYPEYTYELGEIVKGAAGEIDDEKFESHIEDSYEGLALPDSDRGQGGIRRPIPTDVKREVWRRDEGKCTVCGSKERLEFDHIIPFSEGGSDTARNIQLLCEKCNRFKSNKVM